MWSWSTSVTDWQTDRWTDRQTDRQMTCDSKTALCTTVHRAVKTRSTDLCKIMTTLSMFSYWCNGTKWRLSRFKAPSLTSRTAVCSRLQEYFLTIEEVHWSHTKWTKLYSCMTVSTWLKIMLQPHQLCSVMLKNVSLSLWANTRPIMALRTYFFSLWRGCKKLNCWIHVTVVCFYFTHIGVVLK